MLGKLIKHELKAMLNKFSLVSIIFLVVSVIIRIMTLFEDAMESYSPSFMMSFVLIATVFVFGLIGLNFYALFSSVTRFQKNLFGDEGYLMHTLPVPSYYHIITKFIAGLLTWIVSVVICIISVVIAFFGVSEITGIVKTISDLFSLIAEYPLHAFLTFIMAVSAYCALIFLSYLCVSVTNFVPKGKSAINAVMIIGAIILNNIIITVIMEFVTNSDIDSEVTICLIYTGYFALVAVAFFFITNRIISRNLNLE